MVSSMAHDMGEAVAFLSMLIRGGDSFALRHAGLDHGGSLLGGFDSSVYRIHKPGEVLAALRQILCMP